MVKGCQLSLCCIYCNFLCVGFTLARFLFSGFMFCQGPLDGNSNIADKKSCKGAAIGGVESIVLGRCAAELLNNFKIYRTDIRTAFVIEQHWTSHFQARRQTTPPHPCQKRILPHLVLKKDLGMASRWTFSPENNCVLEAWKMRGISQVIRKLSAWFLVESLIQSPEILLLGQGHPRMIPFCSV